MRDMAEIEDHPGASGEGRTQDEGLDGNLSAVEGDRLHASAGGAKLLGGADLEADLEGEKDVAKESALANASVRDDEGLALDGDLAPSADLAQNGGLAPNADHERDDNLVQDEIHDPGGQALKVGASGKVTESDREIRQKHHLRRRNEALIGRNQSPRARAEAFRFQEPISR